MKKFFLFAAVVISLAACNNDDKYIDDPVEAQITAAIGEKGMTRATGTSWNNGDEIGITMAGRYSNIRYTTESGDGMFGGTTMYFKNKREPVTLTAYYPYSGTEGTAPATIDVTTEAERQTSAEQPKFDFLYAIKENVTGSSPKVNFTFSHMMSRLTLNLVNGNAGNEVSKITSCEINGLILEGSFNPVNGICAANTTAAASPLKLSVQPGVDLPSLILFPQSVDKVTLKIYDSEDQEYSCELKFDGNRLESGNNYLYTIRVSKTNLIVEDYAIANWTDKEVKSDATSE